LLSWLISEMQRLRAINAALGAENAALHQEVQDLAAALDQVSAGRIGGVA
jgi:hypothetical protein